MCILHILHWRKAVEMAKMLINPNDVYFITTTITFVIGHGVVDSGRTAPIFRELKR